MRKGRQFAFALGRAPTRRGMRRVHFSLVGAVALISLLGGARAADLPAQTLPPLSAPSCFTSFVDYFLASAQECPLTWNGITLLALARYANLLESAAF